MRIGIIAPPWLPVPPPAYGGTEAVIDRLARGIIDAGHEVVLWTTGDSTCEVPFAWVFNESKPDRMGNSAVEMQHLIHGYDTLRSCGCDIIHDHTLLGPVYSHRYPDLPVVTTNHGPFNGELTDLYQSISSHVPVIAISHEQARTAGLLPVAGVIHHGLDPARFPVGDGAGDERGEYYLFLGRMAPEKGARRAAQAAAMAGVRLKIAAKMREPWERDFFEQAVQPLLNDDIEYVGEVGGSEKLELIGSAKALLNPIRWSEPFGLVMIEALACGTPVVAFPEGSVPEIVDHGISGLLVDSTEAMAEQLEKVDGLSRESCRAQVEEYFSTERMVAEHLELYEEILQGYN